MKTFKILLGTLVFSAISLFTNAQEESQPIFYMVSYMKVQNGNHDDYIALEKAWKKIHEARIKAGNLDGWFMHSVVAPMGTGSEYNYVTVNQFNGTKKLAAAMEGGVMPDNLKELLTEDEMKLVQRTGEIRDMVRNDIVRFRIGAFPGEGTTMPKFAVVNYMDVKEGTTLPEYGELEEKYWKPIHKARVAKKEMNSWGVYSVSIPYGTERPYDAITVDFYDNMEQFWTPYFNRYFKEVHPDADAAVVSKKMNNARDMTRSDIWRVLDYAVKE